MNLIFGGGKMDEIFKELMGVPEVRGALLISPNGKIRYQKVGRTRSVNPASIDWLTVLNSLAGIQEADFLGEKLRIYIRKIEYDCLVVLMGPGASPAMVRLNCDLLLPLLKEKNNSRGLRRLFKR